MPSRSALSRSPVRRRGSPTRESSSSARSCRTLPRRSPDASAAAGRIRADAFRRGHRLHDHDKEHRLNTQRLHGALAPVVTPYTADLAPDKERLIALCRWLVANDTGLAVFGTTSEGNSLSVPEKIALLDALFDAGLPAARMMPGTGCCALTDTV